MKEQTDRSSSVLAFCTRCGHPASWHRLSDDDLGDLPDWRSRCLGYDCRIREYDGLEQVVTWEEDRENWWNW